MNNWYNKKIKIGVSRSKIDKINWKNANAREKNAFDFAMKINLESEVYSELSCISTIELFCKNI